MNILVPAFILSFLSVAFASTHRYSVVEYYVPGPFSMVVDLAVIVLTTLLTISFNGQFPFDLALLVLSLFCGNGLVGRPFFVALMCTLTRMTIEIDDLEHQQVRKWLKTGVQKLSKAHPMCQMLGPKRTPPPRIISGGTRK